MNADRQRVIYLHGFNSSPDSHKARLFAAYCNDQFNRVGDAGQHEVLVPALSHDPERALQTLEDCIGEGRARVALLVGSSLGGYYATYLAEKYGLKAALVNPAVSPCDYLPAEIVGRHRNYYTHEEYEFTLGHVAYLRKLDVKEVGDPSRYFLFVQTGDKTLDYRRAVALYAGSSQLVQQGGSHSFDNFADVLPLILRFAGLAAPSESQE